MSGKLFLRFILSFLVFLSGAAAAASGWAARDTELAPYEGAFAEFCLQVPEGRALDIELSAPQAIDFNVHMHTETGTVFPVRERVVGEVAFSIPANPGGEYCLMWTNPEQRPGVTRVQSRYRVR